MKDLIKALTLFLLPLTIISYVILNGYPEPLGLYVGIVAFVVGSVVCIKGMIGC